MAELSELSWLVVTNGSDSPSSTPLEDVLDQQQVFVVPEIAQVDLSDVPGMEFGLSASAAFAKVHFPLFSALDGGVCGIASRNANP